MSKSSLHRCDHYNKEDLSHFTVIEIEHLRYSKSLPPLRNVHFSVFEFGRSSNCTETSFGSQFAKVNYTVTNQDPKIVRRIIFYPSALLLTAKIVAYIEQKHRLNSSYCHKKCQSESCSQNLIKLALKTLPS